MNEPSFSLNQDPDFKKKVEQAKRKSRVRSILTALLAALAVIVLIPAASLQWVTWKADRELTEYRLTDAIFGANESAFSGSGTSTFFEKQVIFDVTKTVAGIPLSWGTEIITTPVIGTGSVYWMNGMSSPDVEEGERAFYFVNGHRVMEFFHPAVSGYDEVYDDRELIGSIEGQKAVEVGVSFDRAYTEDEVRRLFGERLQWLWVNTGAPAFFGDEGVLPERGNAVAGFDAVNDRSFFADAVMELQNQSGAERERAVELAQSIVPDGDVRSEDIQIAGAVITGTPDQLRPLLEADEIRAVTLGATVDSYGEQ